MFRIALFYEAKINELKGRERWKKDPNHVEIRMMSQS